MDPDLRVQRLTARRFVALIVVLALVLCAVMFVGLPSVLDPYPPVAPVFDSGFFN
jgi:hypothetical protein